VETPIAALLLLAALAAALLSPDGRVSAAQGFPRIFGARRAVSDDIAPFTNWNPGDRARRPPRLRAGRPRSALPASPSPASRPSGAPRASGSPRWGCAAKVDYANAVMNRHAYVPSLVNWGTASYWETPFEFLQRNGQCRTYAGRQSSCCCGRAAGVPNELMRVVVDPRRRCSASTTRSLRRRCLRRGRWCSDNQAANGPPVEAVRNYIPYYSINETGWWAACRPLPCAPRHTARAATAPS